MGIRNLKKWEEISDNNPEMIFATHYDTFLTIFLEDTIDDYQIESMPLHIWLNEYVGTYLYYKYKGKRCFFDNLMECENALGAYVISSHARFKVIMEMIRQGIKYYKYEDSRERKTMDPNINKDTIIKGGNITRRDDIDKNSRRTAEGDHNFDVLNKEGTITIDGSDSLKHGFENASTNPETYISGSPKTNGTSHNVQTFDTTDTTTMERDENTHITEDNTITNTINTNDVKSMARDEVYENKKSTYDPYALNHVVEFMNNLASPLITFYNDFFKEWTSPINR